MILWALILLSTVIAVELFLRLPLIAHVKGLTGTMTKALKVLKSPRISDHWKERTIQAYSLRLFVHSIMVFLILIVALLPFAVTGYAGALAGHDMMPLLNSLKGIGATTVIAIAYFVLRKRSFGAA